ncbi:MAG: GNAT family N-acetyltransferase [Bacteroidetes bacterium]|nr:GNAT family N-acetyltransferase [Bacteroidota bacterium]
MLTIKKYTISELIEFVSSEEYDKLENIPISKHRALSYSKNPRINSNDNVMYLAYDNDELVGYRTILPDYFYQDNTKNKIGWLSGSWVKPDRRRTGISTKLFKTVYKEWIGNLAYTNYAPVAKALFDKTSKFIKFKSIEGIRAYNRFCFADLLPPKSKFFFKIKSVLRFFDFILNLFCDIRIIILNNFLSIKNINFEYVTFIDDEINEFIKNKSEKEICRRSQNELNWIIKYPWIIEHAKKDDDNKRYHFSSTSKLFNNYNIKIYDNNKKLTAYLMLTVRDNRMSVPYCYYDNNINDIIKIIYKLMLKKHLSILTVYNNDIVEYLRNHSTPFLFKKKLFRNYFITKGLNSKFPENQLINFQDGDGDCAFT